MNVHVAHAREHRDADDAHERLVVEERLTKVRSVLDQTVSQGTRPDEHGQGGDQRRPFPSGAEGSCHRAHSQESEERHGYSSRQVPEENVVKVHKVLHRRMISVLCR